MDGDMQLALSEHDFSSVYQALSQAQAVIWFEPNGTILDANRNFLDALGYRLDEVVGQHHRIFVDPEEAGGSQYRQFWENLANGQMSSAEFKRIRKDGKAVFIEATYAPIRGEDGKIAKVVKFAIDVTERKNAVEQVAAGLLTLSTGDLKVRLADNLPEEFQGLKAAFNDTVQRFDDLTTGILGTAAKIGTESEDITGTANDLFKRCEQQAATIEETSASLQEITQTVKSNAERSEEVAGSASETSKQAEDGGEVVKQAIDAMSKIQDSSAEVRKTISIIESIAFQTNLLALNAGVEAARAGDAGRGFAVVASEVRALAQRASEAAREINTLIDSSGKVVSEGARFVDQTGTALSEIVGSISTIAKGIEDINQSGREQNTAITEVSTAISEIDTATQQTAIMSEKNSASATALRTHAAELQKLVSFFNKSQPAKVNRPSESARPPVSAAPATRAHPAAPVRPKESVPTAAATRSTAAAPKLEGELAGYDLDDDWTEF